jgi:hypothetical protein
MLELAVATTAASAVARAAGSVLIDYLRAPPAGPDATGAEGEAGTAVTRDLVADVVETASSTDAQHGREATPKENEPIVAELAESPRAVGTALALDADTVFSDSRKRLSLAFKINVVVTTALSVLLLVGIGGAIVAGLTGRAGWAAAFGGIAAGDVLGLYFYKPLERLSTSLRETQRLELLIVSTRERLAGCLAHADRVEQAKCAERVWTDAVNAVEVA